MGRPRVPCARLVRGHARSSHEQHFAKIPQNGVGPVWLGTTQKCERQWPLFSRTAHLYDIRTLFTSAYDRMAAKLRVHGRAAREWPQRRFSSFLARVGGGEYLHAEMCYTRVLYQHTSKITISAAEISDQRAQRRSNSCDGKTQQIPSDTVSCPGRLASVWASCIVC